MEDNEAEDTQDHGDTEDTPNSGEEKEDEKEVDNIWESWKTLLKTIMERLLPFGQFYYFQPVHPADLRQCTPQKIL